MIILVSLLLGSSTRITPDSGGDVIWFSQDYRIAVGHTQHWSIYMPTYRPWVWSQGRGLVWLDQMDDLPDDLMVREGHETGDEIVIILVRYRCDQIDWYIVRLSRDPAKWTLLTPPTFESCATGPGIIQTSTRCSQFDHDWDGDVDQVDFASEQLR